MALLWYSLRACPVRLHLAPGLEPCGVRISVNAAAALCANMERRTDAEANATRYHLLAAQGTRCWHVRRLWNAFQPCHCNEEVQTEMGELMY